MGLVNEWRAGDGSGGRSERIAFVYCDGCLPPDEMTDTAELLRKAGWKFEHLEAGPHLCPRCSHRLVRRSPRRRSPPLQRPAMPTFLIIGAAKCGTTSLHRYLGAHPEIQMTEVKELRFFQQPDCLDRLGTYASFFDAGSAVRGESTPAYALHPLAPGVPERVHAAVPDVRLIYVVRDPVDRTLSHYLQRRALHAHVGGLEDEIGDLADPYNMYAAASRYATQLERYLRIFPSDRVLVVDQAELRNRRRETLSRVFRYLGADAGFWSQEYERVYNPGETKVRWSRAGWSMAHSAPANAIRRVLPTPAHRALFAPVKRVTTTRLQQPEVDGRLRERLRDALGDEVARLRELTGQPFATWQI